MITIRIPGEMRGKGRPRFRRFATFVATYSDAKTVSMETWIRACAVDQGATQELLTGAIEVSILVHQVAPESWSRKKQAAALAGDIRPTSAPDADNVAKLVCDSLNKLVWHDDRQITRLLFEKRYAAVAETVLTVQPVFSPAAQQEAPKNAEIRKAESRAVQGQGTIFLPDATPRAA